MHSRLAFPPKTRARASVLGALEVVMAVQARYQTEKLYPGIDYRHPVARQLRSDAATPETRAGWLPHDGAAA